MDKPKILIVDDEQDAREYLISSLARNIECEIREACSGRDTLDILKKEVFDLILLDIRMPGISGIDVIRTTRETHPQTDILAISAWDSQQVAQEALREGAVDYIIKPSTPKAILSKISQILKKRNKYLPKEASKAS